jgi:hypothetical protein
MEVQGRSEGGFFKMFRSTQLAAGLPATARDVVYRREINHDLLSRTALERMLFSPLPSSMNAGDFFPSDETMDSIPFLRNTWIICSPGGIIPAG